MAITQLIYYSQPFGFDEAMLNGILLQARRNNPKHGLTGALIVRGDLYMQLLEGPAEGITFTFEKIRRDNRHLAVRLLTSELVPDRLFPTWTMRDDPAHSWLYTADEVADGALEKASVDELRHIFLRMAADLP